MYIWLSIKSILNYLYNHLIDLVWTKKIKFEDGTEINSVNYIQPKNIVFTNVVADNWVIDNTYADYSYKCELIYANITSNMFAQIVFNQTDAESGNYAPVCLTNNNSITIYSKVNNSITIPTIVLEV